MFTVNLIIKCFHSCIHYFYLINFQLYFHYCLVPNTTDTQFSCSDQQFLHCPPQIWNSLTWIRKLAVIWSAFLIIYSDSLFHFQFNRIRLKWTERNRDNFRTPEKCHNLKRNELCLVSLWKKLGVKLKAFTLQWKCVQSLLHCFEFASVGRGRGRERAKAAVRMNLMKGKAHIRLDMPERSSALLPPINLLREQITVFGTFALSLFFSHCVCLSLWVCVTLSLSLSLVLCFREDNRNTLGLGCSCLCICQNAATAYAAHGRLPAHTLYRGVWFGTGARESEGEEEGCQVRERWQSKSPSSTRRRRRRKNYTLWFSILTLVKSAQRVCPPSPSSPFVYPYSRLYLFSVRNGSLCSP